MVTWSSAGVLVTVKVQVIVSSMPSMMFGSAVFLALIDGVLPITLTDAWSLPRTRFPLSSFHVTVTVLFSTTPSVPATKASKLQT